MRVVAALVLAPLTIATAYAGGLFWTALVTLVSIGLFLEWLTVVALDAFATAGLQSLRERVSEQLEAGTPIVTEGWATLAEGDRVATRQIPYQRTSSSKAAENADKKESQP